MYHKVPCDMFLIVESDDNKISFLDSINIQSSEISCVSQITKNNDFDDFSRQ